MYENEKNGNERVLLKFEKDIETSKSTTQKEKRLGRKRRFFLSVRFASRQSKGFSKKK